MIINNNMAIGKKIKAFRTITETCRLETIRNHEDSFEFEVGLESKKTTKGKIRILRCQTARRNRHVQHDEKCTTQDQNTNARKFRFITPFAPLTPFLILSLEL